jgi:flagellin
VAGATIDFTTNASGKGGENAFFSADGRNVTINLAAGQAYTDSQINDLIQSAKWTGNDGSTGQLAAPARIEFKSDSGVINAINYTTQPTVAGQRKTAEIDLLPLMVSSTGGTEGYADKIKFTANQYGSHTTRDGLFSSIKISTMPNTARGQERVTIDNPANPGTAGAEITLHLATGTEYTNQDIENLLRRAGFDYTVEMWNDNKPNGFSTAYFNRTGEVTTSGTASSGNISSGGTSSEQFN